MSRVHLGLPQNLPLKNIKQRWGLSVRYQTLEQAKTPEFLAHSEIALAGGLLKTFAISNNHAATLVVDQSRAMEEPCRQRDGGPGGAEHLAKKIMRQRQPVGFHAVAAGQQPAGEPFFNSMQPVAYRCLRGLHDKGLDIFLQILPQFAGAF